MISLMVGAGRIFDLWGGSETLLPSRCAEEADRRAIYEDWIAVGRDMGTMRKRLGGEPL